MVLFHLFGMMITFRGLMKIAGNAYGVLKHSMESMLLIPLLAYWVIRVKILKVVMHLWKNIIQQDTKSFIISNRPRRVLFLIIQKISNHQFQVYRISHLLTLNQPYTVVPKLLLHQMILTYLKCQPSVLHQIFNWK